MRIQMSHVPTVTRGAIRVALLIKIPRYQIIQLVGLISTNFQSGGKQVSLYILFVMLISTKSND